ncbi:MAG: ATP-binding protein [Kiritimatiellae bacterium]|nr:ATP-binding protein [Kiritimatiellia bacterium]
MRRKADDRLIKWVGCSRRKPILLRGARQVGKTTLVRNFAKSQDLVLNEINLERHKDLADVFASMDTSIICTHLSAIIGRNVRKKGSLLFLDEIQAIPAAIAALRYFYEDMPELPVVAAGSLLEFALAKHSFSMPVGRIEYLHLGPMDFREFAEEINPYLASHLEMASIVSDKKTSFHGEMMKLLRTYLIVGGMPESVLAFAQTHSLSESASVHEQILGTYVDDFAKYANGRDLGDMQSVFRRIPANVGRKVKFVNFARDMKSRDVKSMLDLFAKARVVSQVFNTDANGIPLGAEEDRDVWKPLFLDVGLMNHANGLGFSLLEGLSDVELINTGAIAEQFVGQQLLYRNGDAEMPSLHYWLREGAKNNAEVDFVIADGLRVLPVEVKSGKAGSLRALREMVVGKGLECAVRFDANVASVQRIPIDGASKSYELKSFPLYAAVCL